jgi:hypothetical protein
LRDITVFQNAVEFGLRCRVLGRMLQKQRPQISSTRSRGLGWRMHGSVEDTKLSTNKQHSLSRCRRLRPEGFARHHCFSKCS